jgi:hypothetical protein
VLTQGQAGSPCAPISVELESTEQGASDGVNKLSIKLDRVYNRMYPLKWPERDPLIGLPLVANMSNLVLTDSDSYSRK